MVEETAIRVQINAAKLAGQGIFGILQAVASMLQARQYGQQSIQSLNRQSQALASVELNDKTLPYVRRQLKEYSVDFAITKDKDTGQLNLWFKGQDVDRIQTAIENCIAARGNAYAGNAVTARFTKTVTLPPGAAGFKGWYENGADTYGNVEWASLLYRMDWEALYGVADGIKCRSVGSALTADELQALLAGLNIDPDTARGQVVAFAISCQGHFVYGQPSSLRGGPGNASVGMNLDCSSFVQYCYWAQGLPFAAGNTASYGRTSDLQAISSAEVQPGDLRVVYAAGGEQGHVQMALGGGAWIECCYCYGVCVNMSNAWMESRGCHYFTYAGF